MSRTGYDMKQLWGTPEKVQYLGDKEQEQCLTVVSQNSYYGKGHSRKVTVGITDKDTRRVPIVIQQANRHPDETYHDHDTEDMMIHRRPVFFIVIVDVTMVQCGVRCTILILILVLLLLQ